MSIEFEKYHTEFNVAIRKLFTIFKELPSQKFKSKLHISALQDKMNTGMRTQPDYAITILGPYIWAARDEIRNENIQFFMDKNYDLEIMRLSKEHKFNYENATNSILFMKDAFRTAPKVKQEEVIQTMKQVLQIYTKFVLEQKK